MVNLYLIHKFCVSLSHQKDITTVVIDMVVKRFLHLLLELFQLFLVMEYCSIDFSLSTNIVDISHCAVETISFVHSLLHEMVLKGTATVREVEKP